VSGSLHPSHITNTTFRNISAKYNNTYGGVLYMNTSSYYNLTVARCIFASCTGTYSGGALYLDSSSPSVTITSCRFENNNASSYGFDVYSTVSSCFSGYTPINSCTTSTTSQSVYCSEYKSILTSPCDEKIVCYYLLFINYFFILFFTCKAWCYEDESCSDYCVRCGCGDGEKKLLIPFIYVYD
jgi:hypothetical protein